MAMKERVKNMAMLDNKYNHENVEENKYAYWVDNGYFKCDEESDKKPYCIVLPPPNVTGKLHLGHALDVTLQDIIIRYKKMEGFDTLWLPGMDHAAIATEAKVVKRLKEQGKDKYTVGREEFLNECYNWTHEHADMEKGTGVVNVTPFGTNLGNSRVVERLKCYFIQLFRQRKEVM